MLLHDKWLVPIFTKSYHPPHVERLAVSSSAQLPLLNPGNKRSWTLAPMTASPCVTLMVEHLLLQHLLDPPHSVPAGLHVLPGHLWSRQPAVCVLGPCCQTMKGAAKGLLGAHLKSWNSDHGMHWIPAVIPGRQLSFLLGSISGVPTTTLHSHKSVPGKVAILPPRSSEGDMSPLIRRSKDCAPGVRVLGRWPRGFEYGEYGTPEESSRSGVVSLSNWLGSTFSLALSMPNATLSFHIIARAGRAA